jgi:hypothetical protein
MKNGQPKLSERKSQRSGLFVPPTKSENYALSEVGDFGLKEYITLAAF